MNDKFYIFYHIYLFLDWYPIVKEQMEKLKSSNLLTNSKLKIGVVHEKNPTNEIEKLKALLTEYYNYEIMFIKHTTSSAESDTISQMKNFSDECKKKEKILYFHTKGVTQQKTEHEIPCKNWRRMMEYFLIENWQKCVSILDEDYDCCGINYQNHAAYIEGERKLIKIYNGNFFWVNSEYVKKIDKNFKFEHKYSAENWILSQDHKAYSFFNTPPHINLYKEVISNYK